MLEAIERMEQSDAAEVDVAECDKSKLDTAATEASYALVTPSSSPELKMTGKRKVAKIPTVLACRTSISP